MVTVFLPWQNFWECSVSFFPGLMLILTNSECESTECVDCVLYDWCEVDAVDWCHLAYLPYKKDMSIFFAFDGILPLFESHSAIQMSVVSVFIPLLSKQLFTVFWYFWFLFWGAEKLSFKGRIHQSAFAGHALPGATRGAHIVPHTS